jgi:GNAT superfamily N-acetyltransferase
MRTFQVVDSNLREAMRFFGEATGSGEVCDLEGLRVIYCGLDYGVFNIAMLTGAPPRGWLDARLEACSRYFQERRARWSFWLCEDWLTGPELRQARGALTALGLRQISVAPGMIAEGLAPARRRLPALECVPVADAPARRAFSAITATCFDIPASVAREVYEVERAWCGAYRGFLGLVNGAPVSIVAMAAAAGSLGVYSLATLPEARRQGYGEALLRAAAGREAARTGLQRLVLQSTEAGHSLYRRLGFREAARFSVYLTK